jgi:transposase
VADFLGVHPVTVNRWVRAHRADGDEGLAHKPPPGREPFLTPDQGRTVLGWLRDEPTDLGFRTDLWTARRVAEVVRRTFAVECHPNHLREWVAKRKFSP